MSRAPDTRAAAAVRPNFPTACFSAGRPASRRACLPTGMSWRLEPQSDLVVELHLMPGDEPEPVQVSVGLFFTDERPSRTGYMLRLGRQDIDIAAGPPRLRQRRRVYAAGRRRRARRAAARALSGEGSARVGDAAGWRDRPAHLHQGLELPLAGRLHVRAAAAAAQGHRHRDALHVRQLLRESRESESSSAARHVRPDERVRDGIAVAAGGASASRRSRASRAGLRAEDSARRYRRQREVARGRAAQRAAARRARRVLPRGESPGRCADAAARRRRGLDPTAGRHYDVGRVLLIQQDYMPLRNVRSEQRSR